MSVIQMWPTPPESITVIAHNGEFYRISVELNDIDNLELKIECTHPHQGRAPVRLRLELWPESVRELQALLQGGMNRRGGAQ